MAAACTNPNAHADLDWLSEMSSELDMLGVPATSPEPAEALVMQHAAQPAAVDAFERVNDTTFDRLKVTSHVPTVALGDEQEHARFDRRELEIYSDFLARCIGSAQLGSAFIDSDTLQAWARALATVALEPSPLPRTYEIQRETGLPSSNLWREVEASRTLATSGRAYRSVMSTAGASMAKLPDLALGQVQIKVVDVSNGQRTFEVAKNAYITPGFLMRTTLTFRQDASAGQNDQIVRTLSGWKLSDKLHEAFRANEGESVALLALLAKRYGGDSVVAVSQGIVGPFYFDDMIEPDAIADIRATVPKSSIATFTAFEMRPNAGANQASTWFDNTDAALLTAHMENWAANVSKTWVCSPELVPTLTRYASACDPTLVVRSM